MLECIIFDRLKELQQAMVGGEAKDNEAVKERRRKKKKYAEEHKRKLQGLLILKMHDTESK